MAYYRFFNKIILIWQLLISWNVLPSPQFCSLIFSKLKKINKTLIRDPFWKFYTQLWQIDGKTMESVTDFIFLGSKITADGDCNHDIKTLAPWKKSYDKPKHIKRQRHYFANKGLVKAVISPLVMYGCENWTVKKLSTKELMLLNCDVGKDSWESLGLQEDPTSPS